MTMRNTAWAIAVGSSCAMGLNAATLEPGPACAVPRMSTYAVANGERIIVVGGHGNGFVSLNTGEVFDASGKTNLGTFNLLHPVDSPAVARDASGNLLLAGGSSDLGVPAYSNAELLDLATLTPVDAGTLVRFRADSGAGRLKDGRILLAGAWWTHNDAHTYGELWSPGTKTFTATGPLNQMRTLPLVIPLDNGQAMVVGGMGPTGQAITPSPERFQPEDGSFTLERAELLAEETGWYVYGYHQLINEQATGDNHRYFLGYRGLENSQIEYCVARIALSDGTITRVPTTTSLVFSNTTAVWAPLIANAAAAKPELLIYTASGGGGNPLTVRLLRVRTSDGNVQEDTASTSAAVAEYISPGYTCVVPASTNAAFFVGATTRDNFTASAATWRFQASEVATNLTDGDWTAKQVSLANTPEAGFMTRLGTINNLGFGWPAGFDPFSGKTTPGHGFPWAAPTNEVEATDRVMVITSYIGKPPAGADGYSTSTSRPANSVRPFILDYDLGGLEVKDATLQIFVDDFQAPVWRASYQVTINGQRSASLEAVINSLVQTGPVGKLITMALEPAFYSAVASGHLELVFDDNTTGAGDGYAIDFIKLLVNRKDIAQTGSVTGFIKDAVSGKSLTGVTVTAYNISGQTDTNGAFTLSGVPAGLAYVSASTEGYQAKAANIDITSGQTSGPLTIQLSRASLTLSISAINSPTAAPFARLKFFGYAGNTFVLLTSTDLKQWTEEETIKGEGISVIRDKAYSDTTRYWRLKQL